MSETGALWISPLLVNIKQKCVYVSSRLKSSHKASWRPFPPTIDLTRWVRCSVSALLVVTLNNIVTTHTDTEGTQKYTLLTFFSSRVLWLPAEVWQCLALDPEAYCSHSSTSVRTNCTHGARHAHEHRYKYLHFFIKCTSVSAALRVRNEKVHK